MPSGNMRSKGMDCCAVRGMPSSFLACRMISSTLSRSFFESSGGILRSRVSFLFLNS